MDRWLKKESEWSICQAIKTEAGDLTDKNKR